MPKSSKTQALLIAGLVLALLDYSAAADQGGTTPQFKLFQTPSDDPARLANPADALKDHQKAAEQGDANAQYMVGLIYDVGDGVRQDEAEAAKWYGKAADQGHAAAQYNLGLLYVNGRGVPQDYVHAHLLFSLAAAGSMPAANTEREFISKKMTRAQISEALRLAREWQPKGNAPLLPIPPSAPAEAPSSTEDRNRPR